MRADYRSVNDVQCVDKKNYLLKVCQKEELKDYLYNCMSEKEFEQMMNIEELCKRFYIEALKALYQSSDFESLEYHLVMMNSLFHNQNYIDVKKDLLHKLLKKKITINEYCVIRHLIDFQNIPLARIVEKLNLDFFVGYEECAKICLLEDEYHEAYLYLRRLGDCQNQNLLDLLCSYSLYDYISLMKYYQRKKKVYQWVPSH